MSDERTPSYRSLEVLLPAGETLIHEGDLGDTAYCIVEGEVRVWKRGESGEVELARLGEGSIFGEMSIVDEKPRSASITAVTDTRLKELQRSQFLDSFQQDPEFAISLLRVLFERLRETGAKLTKLQQPALSPPDREAPSAVGSTPSEPAAVASGFSVTLEGLTQPAREALPSNPFPITTLPCRIGRLSEDRLGYNDLALPDFEPYQVSVNHLLIFQERRTTERVGNVGIFDRGSSRGSWLNGQQLGGLMGDDNATYVGLGESELVLGDQDSVFRFRLTVAASAPQS